MFRLGGKRRALGRSANPYLGWEPADLREMLHVIEIESKEDRYSDPDAQRRAALRVREKRQIRVALMRSEKEKT